MNLWDLKLFVFDLDGCLYRGEEAIPGARELLRFLRSKGKRIGFLTNNSRQTAAEIGEKLTRMGLDASAEEVVAATDYAGRYVLDRYGTSAVKVAGSGALQAAVAAAGHRVLPLGDPEVPRVIVLGRDVEFTYEKLTVIANDAVRGARVVAANPDGFHPGEGGRRVPETGALAASVEAMTGERVESYGKPAAYLFLRAMERRRALPEESVMIGDNYHTDIAGGMSAGMRTVWLSDNAGGTPGTPPEGARRPDLAFRNIAELYEFLRGGERVTAPS